MAKKGEKPIGTGCLLISTDTFLSVAKADLEVWLGFKRNHLLDVLGISKEEYNNTITELKAEIKRLKKELKGNLHARPLS